MPKSGSVVSEDIRNSSNPHVYCQYLSWSFPFIRAATFFCMLCLKRFNPVGTSPIVQYTLPAVELQSMHQPVNAGHDHAGLRSVHDFARADRTKRIPAAAALAGLALPALLGLLPARRLRTAHLGVAGSACVGEECAVLTDEVPAAAELNNNFVFSHWISQRADVSKYINIPMDY